MFLMRASFVSEWCAYIYDYVRSKRNAKTVTLWMEMSNRHVIWLYLSEECQNSRSSGRSALTGGESRQKPWNPACGQENDDWRAVGNCVYGSSGNGLAVGRRTCHRRSVSESIHLRGMNKKSLCGRKQVDRTTGAERPEQAARGRRRGGGSSAGDGAVR